MPVDPLTAALTALAYFNQFLNTTAGQAFATEYVHIVSDLHGLIAAILHIHISVPVPTPSPAPTPAS